MFEFPKNDREVVRVTVEDFKGQHLLNIRTWYHTPDGMRPGRAGIAMRADKLPDLVDALQKVSLTADYQAAVRGSK